MGKGEGKGLGMPALGQPAMGQPAGKVRGPHSLPRACAPPPPTPPPPPPPPPPRDPCCLSVFWRSAGVASGSQELWG